MRRREANPFYQMLVAWVFAHNTTMDKLLRRAGVAAGLGAQLKLGALPMPRTVIALADAMGIPRGKAFLASCYLHSEDLVGGSNADLAPDEEALLEDYRSTSETARRYLRVLAREAAARPEAQAALRAAEPRIQHSRVEGQDARSTSRA